MTVPSRTGYAAVLIKKIHVAKRELRMDDAAYREVLKRTAGVDSAAKASEAGLVAAVREMERLGFKTVKPQAAASATDERPQAAKLRALWLSLWQLGVVRNRDDAALAAFVKAETKIDAMRWTSAEDLSRVIEALKGWGERVAYSGRPDANGSYDVPLIEAQWARLVALGAIGEGMTLVKWLRISGLRVDAPDQLQPDQAGHAVRELGQLCRRAAQNAKAIHDG